MLTETSSINTLTADAKKLQQQVKGKMIFPGDENYHSERSVWNAMIDKCPTLIVQCVNTNDVIAAVNFARMHHLVVAVRGGGHNVAGNAVCHEGLMIDLSKMKNIYVDGAAIIY